METSPSSATNLKNSFPKIGLYTLVFAVITIFIFLAVYFITLKPSFSSNTGLTILVMLASFFMFISIPVNLALGIVSITQSRKIGSLVLTLVGIFAIVLGLLPFIGAIWSSFQSW